MKYSKFELAQAVERERQQLVAEMTKLVKRMRVIEDRLAELNKADALLEGMEEGIR